MIVMLARGKPIVIGNWEKGWGIQVRPVAVQSKLKRMQKDAEGNGGKRSLYIPSIRPLSGNPL